MLNNLMDVIFSLFVLSIFSRLVAETMIKNSFSSAHWYQRTVHWLFFLSYYPAGFALETLRVRFPRVTQVSLFGLYFDLSPVLLIVLVHLLRIAIIISGALVAQLLLASFAFA